MWQKYLRGLVLLIPNISGLHIPHGHVDLPKVQLAAISQERVKTRPNDIVATSDFAVVHVIDSLYTKGGYFQERSGIADMQFCILSAVLENVRQSEIAKGNPDMIIVTKLDTLEKTSPEVMQFLEKEGIYILESNITQLYVKEKIDDEFMESWGWGLFAPNMLKAEIFGLTQYKYVIYKDLDFFIGDSVKAHPFPDLDGFWLGGAAPNSPFAGGFFMGNPSSEAYSLALELLETGFSTSTGWGHKGWSVKLPEQSDSKCFESVDCKYLPHYCQNTDGSPPDCSRWQFFAAGGDQGLLYALFTHTGKGFRHLSYEDFMDQFPNDHWYGLGKPWELQSPFKPSPTDPRHKLFWKAWNISKNNEHMAEFQCHSALIKHYNGKA